MVDANFLPPKEAQGKVRQSQGRAATNNFAKTDFRVHRDPLDHLSVLTIKIVCYLRALVSSDNYFAYRFITK